MATRAGGEILGLRVVYDGAHVHSIQHGVYAATMGIQGGVRYFKKQWRDTGLAAPDDKVTLVTTDPGTSYDGVPVGSLVDEVILSQWTPV